ncbi:MAG: hypothetical protein IKC41_04165 [Clostridia bacterium]|nr:hypothetical protein [Clostridia bacterium]
MKQVITKSLCLVLVLCLALAFAGCGNREAAAQEAKTTVTSFMDALINLDMQEAAKYVDDPAALGELDIANLSASTIDTVIENNPAMQPYKDKFVPIFDKALAKAKEVCKYEITSEEDDGVDFIYTINLTTPGDGSKTEEALKNAMAEYLTQDGLMKLMNDLLASGKISASSSEDDILNVAFDAITGKVLEALDTIEIETKTEEMNVTVSETDGKWLVKTVGKE